MRCLLFCEARSLNLTHYQGEKTSLALSNVEKNQHIPGFRRCILARFCDKAWVEFDIEGHYGVYSVSQMLVQVYFFGKWNKTNLPPLLWKARQIASTCSSLLGPNQLCTTLTKKCSIVICVLLHFRELFLPASTCYRHEMTPIRNSSLQNQHPFFSSYFTCSAIDPSRLFWCELLSFGDVCVRDVCPLLDITAKICSKNLNSIVSFMKSWSADSRQPTDLDVSSFMSALSAFHIAPLVAAASSQQLTSKQSRWISSTAGWFWVN